jgi:hypothetical protein
MRSGRLTDEVELEQISAVATLFSRSGRGKGGGDLFAGFAYDRLAGSTCSFVSGSSHDALETNYVLHPMHRFQT